MDPALGEYHRTEHWEAAARQGAQVARAILGDEPMKLALPSFWTDQYGLRIQTVGDATRGRTRSSSTATRPSATSSVLIAARRPGRCIRGRQPRNRPSLRR